MKPYETSDLENLVSYYNTSAYVRTDVLESFAEEIMEEGEDIEDVINTLKLEIECDILPQYQYIECENQGSYHRHIWHKIKFYDN